MLNVKKKDRIAIKIIKRKLIRNTDVVEFYRKQKWKWAGHAYFETERRALNI